jgi:CDP-diacylglycerol--serine O-phosphatidyltransferase
MKLSDRFIDPRSPDRRPRRAVYVLPTMFTAGSLFLGFYALLEAFQGAMINLQDPFGAQMHFRAASIAIGVAVFLDGLDGRIARMTNTVSDFGREMDSLADVISFGVAPAVLAFAWGIQFVDPPTSLITPEQLRRAGYILSFVFLLCGAMRLARFNVQKNPVPKNPGRPDRKYFVGLPIPSGAALVVGVIYATGSTPLHWWILSVMWLVLLGLLAFLMVSTWRYPSFKDLSLTKPRSPFTFVMLGLLIWMIFFYSQPVLLLLSGSYVLSGIVIRVGGAIRRRLRPGSRNPEPNPGGERPTEAEHPIG